MFVLFRSIYDEPDSSKHGKGLVILVYDFSSSMNVIIFDFPVIGFENLNPNLSTHVSPNLVGWNLFDDLNHHVLGYGCGCLVKSKSDILEKNDNGQSKFLIKKELTRIKEDADLFALLPPQKEELPQTRFYCCGRVPPDGPYRKRHGMEDGDGLKKEDSSIEVAVEALENSSFGITKTIGPNVPFIEDIPEELYQGRAIEIHGKLTENASKFSINLSTGKANNSDLALHFNPRFDRHVIIRNHRIKSKWGVEEIVSLQPFPFQIKRSFSVLIFVADEQFLIAVNKIHFCAFAFRIPIDKVKSLIVLGDIILSFIQHYDRTSYPPQIFKRTPFIIIPVNSKKDEFKCNFRRKIKSIREGSKIDIFGRLKVLPRAFYVNLQKGIDIWPHPIIPFHMNYRLHQPGTHKNEREIIFNSWSDGLWGKEEIITFCPFLPGTPFHIKLLCKTNGIGVFVNDKYLFNHSKTEDLDVDSVVIHGDVVVSKVMIH